MNLCPVKSTSSSLIFLRRNSKRKSSALDEDTFKERAELVALQQEIARAYRAS